MVRVMHTRMEDLANTAALIRSSPGPQAPPAPSMSLTLPALRSPRITAQDHRERKHWLLPPLLAQEHRPHRRPRALSHIIYRATGRAAGHAEGEADARSSRA